MRFGNGWWPPVASFEPPRVLISRAPGRPDHQTAGGPPSGTRCGCWNRVRAATSVRLAAPTGYPKHSADVADSSPLRFVKFCLPANDTFGHKLTLRAANCPFSPVDRSRLLTGSNLSASRDLVCKNRSTSLPAACSHRSLFWLANVAATATHTSANAQPIRWK